MPNIFDNAQSWSWSAPFEYDEETGALKFDLSNPSGESLVATVESVNVGDYLCMQILAETFSPPSSDLMFFAYQDSGSSGDNVSAGSVVEFGVDELEAGEQVTMKFVDSSGNDYLFTSATITLSPCGDGPDPDDPGNYNCIECGESRNTETLGNLRRRLMVRLGHAASASRPPAGMIELLNDFLMESQRFLFEKVASFRESRFFEWEIQQGVRMYGYSAGASGCSPIVPELVEGVYVCDGDPAQERWVELAAGIDPRLYTGGISESWPSRYEFRQCIELWPAPDARSGRLRVKAKADLLPFAGDSDRTTIDSDLVFMLALANAKSHYNKPDAAQYNGMVQSRIGDLIAASHHTRRYIPGDDPWQPPSPPIPKDGFL